MTTTFSPGSPPTDTAPADPPGLPRRLAALERLTRLGAGRVDGDLAKASETLLDRGGQRLRLSGDHTVVALAGGTGSGKSSLFNAICGLELSPTGLRRPMTSVAHACVWGLDGAGPLLDWLEVEKRFRYARASALDRDEGSLQGLVLLDLPDHDSIRAAHVLEVNKYVEVADLLVWVLDPQKYADFAVHHRYLEPLAGHSGVTLIVLNQVDRLEPAEVADCVTDLRRLLEAEGLKDPHVLTTSTVSSSGIDDFRDVLIDTVAARRARTARLNADAARLSHRFLTYRGEAEPAAAVSPERVASLTGALAAATGVPAVAEAMESAYEIRANDFVGWPAARFIRRFRADPLRRMRLGELRQELRGAFTGPVGAQQADVDRALMEVGDSVIGGIPAAWQRTVRAAARTHAEDLPESLGTALRDTVPDFNQVPSWWWLVRMWQSVLSAVAAVSFVWLIAVLIVGVGKIGHISFSLIDTAGVAPYAALIFVCALFLGLLSASASRNVISLSSAKHRERLESRMRDGIATLARRLVLGPVETELATYAEFRRSVMAATTDA